MDGHGGGFNRFAAGRFLIQAGTIQIPVIRHGQAARDWRRRHDQQIDPGALVAQRHALMHAKAMLLVDDRQGEVVEFNAVLEQGVGADDQGGRAAGHLGAGGGAGLAFVPPGQHRHLNPDGGGQRTDCRQVLARQNFGWRHQGGLGAGLNSRQHGQQGDHGFTAADVALQQAQHALRGRHVGANLAERPFLRLGQRKAKGGEGAGAQPAVAGQHPATAFFLRPPD